VNKTDTVYDLAEDQMGYFTAEQAAEVGIARHDLVRMTQREGIQRISWGLYRLRNFPRSVLDQYMEATLWPRGVHGVLSHETALDLHALSDVNPAKIHITIPKPHRIRRTLPRNLVVHRGVLPPSDITLHEGMKITTVVRTIRDCHSAHVSSHLLTQALAEGRRRGKLTASEADRLSEEILSQRMPIGEEPVSSHG
jgi:predicted transcriptional regulator of viral defense system